MDEIAAAGPVGRVVVVTPHVESFAAHDRNLRHEGDKVVGNALWIFADQSTLMRAYGIEVTQDRYSPARIARIEIAEHVLDHQLCSAIGIDSVQGMPLGIG